MRSLLQLSQAILDGYEKWYLRTQIQGFGLTLYNVRDRLTSTGESWHREYFFRQYVTASALLDIPFIPIRIESITQNIAFQMPLKKLFMIRNIAEISSTTEEKEETEEENHSTKQSRTSP